MSDKQDSFVRPPTLEELKQRALAELCENGDVVFHNFEPETELAVLEMGFEPQPFYITWVHAYKNGIAFRKTVQINKEYDFDITTMLIAAAGGQQPWKDWALIWAYDHSHFVLLEKLLAAGADPNVHDTTLLKSAAVYDETELVKILLASGAKVDPDNNRPLCHAVRAGCSVETVQVLLDEGADATAREDYALQWAAKHGDTAAVVALLDAGSDLHRDDDNALRVAAKNGSLETVELLLARGANVHADNDAALRHAADQGHTDIVKLLLAAGADVNICDNEALLCAANAGHAAVVKILLDAGASNVEAALELAECNRNATVVVRGLLKDWIQEHVS